METVIKYGIIIVLLLVISINVYCVYINDKRIKTKYLKLVDVVANYTWLFLISLGETITIYYLLTESININFAILSILLISSNMVFIYKFNSLIIYRDAIVEENFFKGELTKILWDDITKLVIVQRNIKSKHRNACQLYVTSGEETTKFDNFTFMKTNIITELERFNNHYDFEFHR